MKKMSGILIPILRSYDDVKQEIGVGMYRKGLLVFFIIAFILALGLVPMGISILATEQFPLFEGTDRTAAGVSTLIIGFIFTIVYGIAWVAWGSKFENDKYRLWGNRKKSYDD